MILCYLVLYASNSLKSMTVRKATSNEIVQRRIEVSKVCSRLQTIEKLISILLNICYASVYFYCSWAMYGRDDYMSVCIAIITLWIVKKILIIKLLRDVIAKLYDIDTMLADYLQISIEDFGQLIMAERGITTIK